MGIEITFHLAKIVKKQYNKRMGQTEKDAGQPEEKGKVGRPLKYETPEELETAVDAFFKAREEIGKPPTQAGLAIALGFKDRQSLRDYDERKEYSCIIKKAMLYIEDFHECRLTLDKCTGSIVWLNSWAGYSEKREVKHSGALRVVATDVDEKL